MGGEGIETAVLGVRFNQSKAHLYLLRVRPLNEISFEQRNLLP